MAFEGEALGKRLGLDDILRVGTRDRISVLVREGPEWVAHSGKISPHYRNKNLGVAVKVFGRCGQHLRSIDFKEIALGNEVSLIQSIEGLQSKN